MELSRRIQLATLARVSIFLVFGFAMTSSAQEIVLVDSGKSDSQQVSQIKELVYFFGLQLRTIEVGSSEKQRSNSRDRSRKSAELKILSVIAGADVLPSLDGLYQNELRSATNAPLLIFGITPDAANDLTRWSNGAISSCFDEKDRRFSSLHIAGGKFGGVLQGTDLPVVSIPSCNLLGTQPGLKTNIQTLISQNETPILAEAEVNGKEVYFLPRLSAVDSAWKGEPASLGKVFSSVAPLLMFIKKTAGEYAWHLDGQFANFTIDDPWLTEPYGNLNYISLLASMKLHRFHTTIAYIPWNYDRSHQDVVELFRKSPEFFSICLHGNNHAHREFGDYALNSLANQQKDISQSVARMEEFHKLTGLNYDRFMVFPHGVAPEQTFAALNQKGFLGTANSLNVPFDESFPKNPVFLLRNYTDRFSKLLSFSRYSAEVPVSRLDIAIQMYLGNPILLYGHQAMFRDGATELLSVVDQVNRWEPNTRWTSLGEVARHTYLIRRRTDAGFDVKMMSNEMTLASSQPGVTRYHIANADENAKLEVSVVDGRQSATDNQELVIELRPEQSRNIRIVQAGSYAVFNDIGRGGLYVWGLRMISDFRDRYLSRIGWGDRLIRIYYTAKLDSFELVVEHVWKMVVGLVSAMLLSTWLVIQRRKRRLELSKSV